MKTLKENLKTIATYAEADTVNAEGFAAWTPSRCWSVRMPMTLLLPS